MMTPSSSSFTREFFWARFFITAFYISLHSAFYIGFCADRAKPINLKIKADPYRPACQGIVFIYPS
jgi:hypothetical protein